MLCGAQPNSEHCFGTKDLQIFYNCADESWSDDSEHYHTESDEIYIVLEGSMNIEVEGKLVSVNAGEYLCIPRKERHQLMSVETPHKSLVVRGPSVQDKILS
ncbi:MAG: cupin domain-containing protein [bacterium]